MFGSHLSIAGSMVNALDEASRLGLDTVQVFTKNQRQWKVAPLPESERTAWLAAQSRLGWQGRTVSHASYLINLASVNDELWAKSLDLMTVELERCEALSIAFLVHHPGSFVGSTLDAGLARIEDAYAELFKRTKGFRVVTCLEGTAGAGSSIGGPFEHLAALRTRIADRTGLPDRVAFCLDSCHLHAAGHDLSTREAADAALAHFDALCGLAHVRVWHLNDSKGKLASHLDRHEHIGQGEVGGPTPDRLPRSGFAAILQHPLFQHVPKILETPKEPGPDGNPMDATNLARLRSLLPGAPASPSASPPSSPKPRPKPRAPRKPSPIRTRKRK